MTVFCNICEKFGLDIEKGLLISGPVGCGKTSLMKLLKYMVPHQRPYEMIPSRNVVFGFNHLGYKTIEDYGNSSFFCFDDLGVEPPGRFYGKDCNVMGEVLLSRYELYLDTLRKIKTHATTNLNAQELEERYGNRVRSRMRELFNLVLLIRKVRINGYDKIGGHIIFQREERRISYPCIWGSTHIGVYSHRKSYLVPVRYRRELVC